MKLNTPEYFQEQWHISKPSVTSQHGMVASQHYVASETGAQLLRDGGNAVDAAIATSLALGIVEPPMSGLGGGGYMTIYVKKTNQVHVIEFGVQAPFNASISDYPLTGKTTEASSFHWPEVKDDRNIHGPLSIAVPGYIKGLDLALEHFGSRPWHEVIAPACDLARKGLPTNWYTVHYISKCARTMRHYDEISRVLLPEGLPPSCETIDGSLNHIQLGNLPNTYATLQREGPESIYSGSLSALIVEDLNRIGSEISRADLNHYEASVQVPTKCRYRENLIYTPTHRCAGLTLVRTLNDLQSRWSNEGRSQPNAKDYSIYTETLLTAYEYRLKHLGEGVNEKTDQGATSHICVVDKHGNLVSLTQTLLSVYGSYVMLPQTGILMNNGMMWFDPRPGRPNSIAGGRRPLSNMCPTIGITGDGRSFAVGACGGRHILPAVYQIISFLCDFGLNVTDALHLARVDVSGTDLVSVMDNLPENYIKTLKERFKTTRIHKNGMSPNLFGVPQLIVADADRINHGGCMIASPMAAVVAE